MAGAAGIEPAITVLETVAIPFNYAPSISNNTKTIIEIQLNTSVMQ